MTTTSVVTGDTVRVKITFRDSSDVLTNADSATTVTFTAYDAESLSVISTANASTSSTGIYFYDWTIPDTPNTYIVELKGTFGGKTQLERRKVRSKFRTT